MNDISTRQPEERSSSRVRNLVLERHVNIGNVDLDQWSKDFEERIRVVARCRER